MGRFKCYFLILIVLLFMGLATDWWDGNGEKLQAYYDASTEPTVQLSTSQGNQTAKTVPPGVTPGKESLNRLVHVGQFGLGHRMSKMSGAYHLARRLRDDANVPLILEAQWGQCESTEEEEGGSIFEYLFADPILLLPGDISPQPVDKPVTIRITNDCPGYFKAQNFKNTGIPVPRDYTEDTLASPFFHKMDTDYHLFGLLQSRFETLHPDAKEFREKHRFDDHTVIGLHIRAGNGEQEHFQWAGRGMGGNDFLANLSTVLQKLVEHLQQSTSSKPLLLFLATDTPTMIQDIRQIAANTWNIPVVTFEQPVLPFNGGVSFQALKMGRQCLEGWKAMMVDTILMGSVDVLVAALRSSFSQTMPLAMVFGHDNPLDSVRFCEVSESGDTMTCLKNRRDWLFRDASSKEITFSTNPEPQSVVHLAGVHYPDIDLDAKSQRQHQVAINFLKGQGTVKDPTTTFLPWGSGFNRKYRQMKSQYTAEWNYQ